MIEVGRLLDFLKANKSVELLNLNTESGFSQEYPGLQYSIMPLSSADMAQSYPLLYAMALTGLLCKPAIIWIGG